MTVKQQLADSKSTKTNITPYTAEETELRTVMLNVINQYRTLVFPEAYEIIKNKLLFHGDLRASLNSAGRVHSTAMIAPLLSGRFDSFSSNLYDTSMTPKVSARDEEDKSLGGIAQDFCDWSQDVSDAEQVKQLARNEAGLIGTSYGIAGWDKRNYEKEYNTGSEVKTFKKSISKPSIDFVSFFEMFYPLATTDFYKAPWKARRKIISLKEIKKRYGNLIKFDKNDVENKIQSSINECISSYDFTKIYEIKSYEKVYESANKYDIKNPVGFMEDNVLLSISDKNPFCEVIEYFEGDDLTIMINGRIYYDGASPYPIGDPFGIIVYEKVPGTCRGIGIGQKVMPYQRQATFYLCKIKDAIGSSLDPSYLVAEGLVKDSSGKSPQTISHVPGMTYTLKDPTMAKYAIQPIGYVDYNVVSIAVSQYQQQFIGADEAIGTNSYVQGGQGKVERSFGAANMKAAVTITRLKPINNSLSRFDQHMFEQWLALASIFNDDEFAIKVMGKDAYDYKTINPSTLIDKFDITVDVESLRDLTKGERSQAVLNALNAISPYNVNPISNTPTIDPSKIIDIVAGAMDFDGFSPMTSDEKVEYVKNELNIQKMVQENVQLQQTTPIQQPQNIVPNGDMSFDQVPPRFNP